MKTFILLLMAGVVMSNIKEINATDNYSESNALKKIIALANFDTVPPTIRTSFDQKYPKASKVTWYRYAPDKTMTESDMWYSTLDKDDYYVSFNWNDADYIAWYDNGTWVRASQQIDNIDIPAAVMRAINTDYAGYRITDVDLEYDQKQSLYEVKMVKGDSKWNVHYTPAGTVFKKKERRMNKTDAQSTLVTDFNTRYPNATGVAWYQYTSDDRIEVLPVDWDYAMDASDYEVRFVMDGSDYSAWYNDGKWIRSEVVMTNGSRLPVAINTAIKDQYSGYTVTDVLWDQEMNASEYQVVMTKGAEKCKITFKQDGTMVKKKCKTS